MASWCDLTSGGVRTAVLAALALSAVNSAMGAVLLSESVSVNTAIPDGSSTGLESIHTVVAPLSSITSISVTLSIAPKAGESAFLGDLYAYLRHGDSISILLNRPGRRADESAGYDDDQPLSVTFQDGSQDIHSYRVSDTTPLTGPLLGTFSPDGRATDPDAVLVTDDRTRMLDVFLGADPSGDWTLFVSDLSGGGAHELLNWGLEMDATLVPEPEVFAVAAGLVGWMTWRFFVRRNRQEPKPSQ